MCTPAVISLSVFLLSQELLPLSTYLVHLITVSRRIGQITQSLRPTGLPWSNPSLHSWISVTCQTCAEKSPPVFPFDRYHATLVIITCSHSNWTGRYRLTWQPSVISPYYQLRPPSWSRRSAATHFNAVST